jgi:tetratricopeptide (TPR) repeat protein
MLPQRPKTWSRAPLEIPLRHAHVPRKDDHFVTFPDVETNAQTPVNMTRQKRQLAEQAIAQASAAQWADAAETNRRLLELGPDAEAENRLAKAHWEMGELAAAREHYQTALALDPTNRIAERNIDRLKMLMMAAGEKTVAAQEGSKASVSIFVEETGKTGFAFLTDLADPRQLAQVNPGDAVELTPEGNRLIAHSNGVRVGVVEPRVAARLLKLMADGNKYAAGVTSLGDKDVRIILREIFQDPRNYGKVSFPTAAKSTDLRPYTKGTLVREEMELEEDLEDDDEDDEIEDLDRVLPPESTTDEAFEEEQDELDEA